MNFDIETVVASGVASDASDIHLIPGKPVMFRINGKLTPQPGVIVTHEMMVALMGTQTEKVQQEVKAVRQSDFAMKMSTGVRLRANFFMQRKGLALVLRIIRTQIRPFEQLGLPNFIRDRVREMDHGMVLCVGPTGSGKSSTLAAIIQDKVNVEDTNIITVEDPIEYVYDTRQDQNSIISQREVGRDVLNFQDGIRAALREDPDILLVGEMRDYETISSAITMAETGHILLSTLHANTGAETISRIVDSFPADQQNQVRTQLSMVLKMVISQRLIPAADGGRCLAYEVMTNNYAIATKIRENKINEIPQVFEVSVASGEMISFERCLAFLYKTGKITREVALESSIDKERLMALLERQ